LLGRSEQLGTHPSLAQAPAGLLGIRAKPENALVAEQWPSMTRFPFLPSGAGQDGQLDQARVVVAVSEDACRARRLASARSGGLKADDLGPVFL
jgi:hypothetical protein